MKRHPQVAVWLMIPALLAVSGCLEVKVRTTVSADGSSERVVSMETSSRNVPEAAFPVTTDSTWRVEWKDSVGKDGKYEYVARKRFQTPGDLSREYSARPDTGPIGLRVSLHKRFEWFYSYFDYREVYTRRNIFNNVPVSDFLTKDEIERYVHGEESDSLKLKTKTWDDRNTFEEFFRPLVVEAQRRNDPALPPSLLTGKKEELFLRVMAAENEDKKGNKKGADSTDHAPEIELALRMIADVLHTPAVFSLRPAADQAWTGIVEKMGNDRHPDSWTCSLQMPGLLLATNSNVVDGNLVTWKIDADRLKVGDYAMQATSRTANVWAFVVTGAAALAVIIMAVVTFFRRRHTAVA